MRAMDFSTGEGRRVKGVRVGNERIVMVKLIVQNKKRK
jgi:hypothetical protein